MLHAERSTAKSYSAPVTLGMPSLKPIPANSAMQLQPSNYDKPVPKDPRYYAAHVTAISTSYSRHVAPRPGVHIPTARTLTTNSPANHTHPAITATSTQQKSPYGLYHALQQPSMHPNARKPRYTPKTLFPTERQRPASQPSRMVALGPGLRMAHTGHHRPPQSQSHRPQDRNLNHTPQSMHKPRSQMPQAIASPHPMCERGYGHSMPRHAVLAQPENQSRPEPPRMSLSPESPTRTKPLKVPQPFGYSKVSYQRVFTSLLCV